MKSFRIFFAMAVISLLLVSCKGTEISKILMETLSFNQEKLCYDEHKAHVDIKFQFPMNVVNNSEFKKGTFWGSSEFENMDEAKQFIIDHMDEVNIDFIFFTDNNPASLVSVLPITYNAQTDQFTYQIKPVTDAWYFSVPFQVPKDLREKKERIYGSLRVQHENTYSYSKNVIISYEACCSGEQDCPDGQKWDSKQCQCIEIKPEKEEKIVEKKANHPPFRKLSPNDSFGGLTITDSMRTTIIVNGRPTFGYLYTTRLDMNNSAFDKLFHNGKIIFPLCDWTLDDFTNSNATFYYQVWKPLIQKLAVSLKKQSDSWNHFSILVQGAADKGVRCKSVRNMTDMEEMIYSLKLYHLNRLNQYDHIMDKGQINYSDPVRNEDLPNLRASFIKWSMQSCATNLDVAVIDGEVTPDIDPYDRRVTLYILQTPIDMGKTHIYYFQ